MSPEFKEIFSKCAGNAFAKQLAFADFLGERGWGVDISKGTVTFGDDLSFPIQLLGTESDGDDSWLWAWANEASNLPQGLLQTCHSLKKLGEERSIPELTERAFPREPVNGHLLAMVASSLTSGCCYYRGPYEGGALFFLVTGLPKRVLDLVEPSRAITVITEVLSQFEVDHAPMSESFLSSQGFSVSREDQSILAKRQNSTISISLDTEDRITNIEGTLNAGTEKPIKKKGWRFWK